jgi:hypothetical protein
MLAAALTIAGCTVNNPPAARETVTVTAGSTAPATSATNTQATVTPPTTTAATIPPGAQSSRLVAGLYLPPTAQLESAEDTAPGAERWDIAVGTTEATTQVRALLPIGKALGRYPWCEEKVLGDVLSWIWGRRDDSVIVGVSNVTDNYSVIVVRTNGYAYDCS